MNRNKLIKELSLVLKTMQLIESLQEKFDSNNFESRSLVLNINFNKLEECHIMLKKAIDMAMQENNH